MADEMMGGKPPMAMGQGDPEKSAAPVIEIALCIYEDGSMAVKTNGEEVPVENLEQAMAMIEQAAQGGQGGSDEERMEAAFRESAQGQV